MVVGNSPAALKLTNNNAGRDSDGIISTQNLYSDVPEFQMRRASCIKPSGPSQVAKTCQTISRGERPIHLHKPRRLEHPPRVTLVSACYL